MEEPLEVTLRNIEYTKMRQALEAWGEAGCPEDDNEPTLVILRHRVANLAAAQKLVESKVQSHRLMAQGDSLLAEWDAVKGTGIPVY